MTRIAGATEAIITPNRPPGRTALAMAVLSRNRRPARVENELPGTRPNGTFT